MEQTGGAGEQPNRIQVVVRVRPVLPHELSDDVAVTCSSDARKLQVLLPDRLAGGAVLPGATRSGARSYEFDACLPGQTTQEELYDICGLSELVDAALDGYCVTVFAFGQTGSGKTHTIIGPRLSRGAPAGATTTRLGSGGSACEEPGAAAGGSASGSRGPSVTGADGGATMGRGGAAAGPPGGILVDPEDGILTRAIAAAYRSMEARSAGGGVEFNVSASVVELYNESVTDLLALDKSKTLAVRKDTRDGFAVTGLTQVACPSDVSAVRYLVKALQYRHTRGHKLNEYSSRSHCIMTFVFASKEAGPEGQTGAKGGIRRYGKLALVDLAGSERLKDTGNTEKGAVRETGAINKSLFTLGQVLSALSARSCGAASTFVPYRDSKLTQLLWDGLRGSGRCLMLACLGPMRAAAEESLNTLHFATMATRIKAEPVVLLDPQDALVLELRKTITELRQENRTLAGALQQLSSGVEPGAVLAALPDTLRQQAATASASAPAAGTPGDAMPQRPGHLQPLAGPGPLRQSYSADGPGSSFDGYPSASPSPSALVYGVSGGVAPLRPTPSPAGARGSAGEVGSPSRMREGRQPRFSGGGQPPGSGGAGRRPAPLGMGAYGASPSPMRAPTFPPQSADAAMGPGRSPAGAGAWKPGNGGAAAASGKSSPSQRSRSVGRNGGAGAGAGAGGANRPSYLTEDPAALLHGYSNVLQPPPPSSSGSSTSIGMGGPGAAAAAAGPRRATTMPVAPPPPALDEFPELAAMEAEFQNLMANSGGGGGSGFNAVSALKSATGGAGPGGGPAVRPPPGARSSVTGGSESGGADGADGGDDGGPKPDVRALKWAERNHWFGTDYDMTAYAYQVHDRLVDREHVDPTSDTYYMEIERRVAERFPDKWAVLMPREALPGGSGAAAAAAVRRAAPSPGRVRPPGEAAAAAAPHGVGGTPPRPPQPATSFGAGLRVNVKEQLFGGGGGSGAGSGSFGYGELQLGGGGGSYGNDYGGSGAGAVQVPYSLGTTPLPGTPNSLAGVGGSGAINPFNIGALHSMAPPKGAAVSRFAQAPGGGGQGLVLTPAGAGADGYGFGGGGGVGGDASAAERIAREYARQRAMVVEELRRAKEEAEAERQRILARIQRAAGGSKWR
ncbi:hypothetical protein HXX76_000843 [Chlamydomonas incerta]|uniref:Kinesin motor domain-containing protein n=1 Tax=Chlamydomonas incerta TaxID=51695 RepID=A0A835WFG1_CHLIN|nr:hypothetical protein HXX76_000843 [Chlamydomonas incerta]|eukprot:KAG2446251.1 hypothetical protein HXX76_000843 [Chlamydomonas incerta]